MEYRCCCNCKEVVGRIAEEVKAETEQWTDMQEMLDQVRQEMEELRSSRDLWQRRAVASELNIPSLYSQVSKNFSVWSINSFARHSTYDLIELEIIINFNGADCRVEAQGARIRTEGG